MGIVINDILVTDMSHKTWKIKYLSETHMERQIQMQTWQEPAASLREGGRCWVFNLSIGGLGHSEVGGHSMEHGTRDQTELGSRKSRNISHSMESIPWVLFWSLTVFPVKGDCWHALHQELLGLHLAQYWHTPADHHLRLSVLLTALPSNVCVACS